MTTEVVNKTITVAINGKSCHADLGQTIIQVADREGVYIPRFCYHEKLSVVANCRMCLVEVANVPKPLPACATPVSEGMQVMTNSPMAVQAQRSVMAFLLINHPLDCPVCDQGGNCELQDLSMGYGSGRSEFAFRKRAVEDHDIGPLIKTHMTRCIHCTRCVRFGEEVAGMRELGATGRGEHMEIGTYVSRMVKSEMSANVIDICPVGALTSKPFAFQARHWEMKQHPSIATHDAVGSHLYIHHRGHEHHRGRTVMKVVPREATSINENWLSDRDRFGYLGVHHHERLKQPEIKRGDTWHVVSWMEALGHVQLSLQQVLDDLGPDAIGGLASTQCTTETLYVWQSWLRGLGCHHIDARPQQRDTRDDACPIIPPLDDVAGVSASDRVLLLGACLREEAPMLNYHVRKAVLQGAKVCSINAQAYDANHAMAVDVCLPPSQWVSAVAHLVVDVMGDRAPSEVQAYTKGAVRGDLLDTLLSTFQSGHRRLLVIGADAMAHPMASALRQMAMLLQEASNGTLSIACLPTGPNFYGAVEAGALPQREVGGACLPDRGDDAMAMMQAGKEAYVLLNVEPEWDHADPALALKALRKASSVVVMSSFVSDQMRDYATVLLPIAPFAYDTGSMINVAGLWQSFEGLPCEDQIMPAWMLCKALALKMSVPGLDFDGVAAIREHLRAQRVESTPLKADTWQWPDLPKAPKGLQLLLRTHMYQIDPLLRRADALQAVAEARVHQVMIHPEDAEQLSIHAGDRLAINRRFPEATFEACISDRMAKGAVMIYRHDGSQWPLCFADEVTLTRGSHHGH